MFAGIIINTEYELSQLHGKDYPSVREAVGGYIELVMLRGEFEGYALYVNEEGKINGLPINDLAPAVWEMSFGLYTDIIVGNAVIMSAKTNDEGEHFDLTDDEVEDLVERIHKAFARYNHPSRSMPRTPKKR